MLVRTKFKLNLKNFIFLEFVVLVSVCLVLITDNKDVLAVTPPSINLTTLITTSADDVNESNAQFVSNTTTLWLGGCGSTSICNTGLRFLNLTIPQGATITGAKLNVNSSQSQWISVAYKIYAEKAGNSVAFSSSNKPSQRILTTNFINHNDNVNWANNTWYNLDDMSSVVQEVINGSTWQSGNSLSVIVKATTPSGFGRKFINAYDKSSASAPQLIITYTSNNPTPTPTATPQPTPTNTPTPTVIPTSTPTPTLIITATPTPTDLPTSTPTVTPTVAPTNTPTPTGVPATAASFVVGSGNVDVVPHQLVRVNSDRLYTFGANPLTRNLRGYWTTGPGYPNSGSDFAGSVTQVQSANVISTTASYDGGNIIHVIMNLVNGSLVDSPFDITTNTFKAAKTLSTGNQTTYVDIGTSGVSAMFDSTGILHVAYWSNSNHITYVGYTYNSSTDSLTVVNNPTQVDGGESGSNSNHPSLAVSPVDNSLIISWVVGTNGSGKIFIRTRSNTGTWGTTQQVSTAVNGVWTSPNSGLNIDQGPSIVFSSDGKVDLSYIENFDSTGDYGKIHFVTNSSGSYSDQALSFYTHDPAIAIDNNDNIFILGHGHPKDPSGVSSACRNEINLCSIKRNSDGTWSSPQLIATPPGSDSFDASTSIKWSAVGWNRPETIEFAFFDAVGGNYNNTNIWYGRLATSGGLGGGPTPTNTPTPTFAPTDTPTPTLIPTNTPTPTTAPTSTPTPTPVNVPSYIQSNLSKTGNLVSSLNSSFTLPVTSGNLIVVAVSAWNGNNNPIISSITDNFSNSYQKAVEDPTPNTNSVEPVSIWYAQNVIGGSNFTVTTNMQNSSSLTVAIHEYSGLTNVSTLDQIQHNSGAGSISNSGLTGTTLVTNELIFSATNYSNPVNLLATSGANYNLRQSQTDNGCCEVLYTEDQIVNAIGAYQATFNFPQAVNYRSGIVTFKGN